jgi:lipopolysaccharide/colanic/teichoic acid biosynthesis glycosyltransferase
LPIQLQRLTAAAGLVLVSPVLLVLAVWVRLSSPGPILYRAERISRGRRFVLYKFRTMHIGSDALGPRVSVGVDARVTPLGRRLRRTRLDELPQLWNVVRGDMALVGPRPEDPRFVDWADPLHRLVFSSLPGITGPTALAFRDEGVALADEATALAREQGRLDPTDEDVERAYRDRILPRKLAMDAGYLRSRSLGGDLRILGRTLATFARGID